LYTGTIHAKRFHLKPYALSMRRRGSSIGLVERKLQIPRSTLSGWFKDIKLTNSQKEKIRQKSLTSLFYARKKAIKWHNLQKEDNILKAKVEAQNITDKVNYHDKILLEIALSMLYLGEGSKDNVTSIGNTNSLILKFFINSVHILYEVNKSEIRCELHLRSDQNPTKMISYWSKELEIPKNHFSDIKDKRKVKSKTYPSYKGVCVVRCGQIALLRRLGFIGGIFCNKIAILDA
jgi:hypothetical protein